MKMAADNMNDIMSDAVEKKDENLMKRTILRAMDLFLKNELDKEGLYDVAVAYMSVPIDLGWREEFDFNDRKLRYVLEEITGIEDKSPERAREIISRCIEYLEEK